jgi:hypothetical protein
MKRNNNPQTNGFRKENIITLYFLSPLENIITQSEVHSSRNARHKPEADVQVRSTQLPTPEYTVVENNT